jgi:Hsp70 protein
MVHRVVCAIDFGTHGSGFAWCSIDADNADPGRRHIYYFDNWADQPTTYPKNLSALLLDADGEVLEWGYRARRARAEGRGARLVHGFKMWLREEARTGAGELGGTPAQAYPLVVAYLTRLHDVALENITNGGYKAEDIRWCLTVPAMWEENERNLMRRAAQDAGFPVDPADLLLVPEPEAATVHTAAKGALATRTDPVMVVDCGGGTVDIAAYQPMAAGGTLKELGRPEGRRLGSDYINEHFRVQYLQPRLGPTVVEELRSSSAGGLQRILDQFEQVKIGYSSDDGHPTGVPLDAEVLQALIKHEAWARFAERQRGVSHQIVLEPADLQKMFEGVVTPLLSLVGEQIGHVLPECDRSSGPLSVVLVGGFAQSPYVQRRVREFLHERFPGDAVLVVLPDPARAVLAGAVHYAYSPQVVLARKARRTYGVGTALQIERGRFGFERKDHRLAGRRITDARGRKLRDNRFQVFVRAGESVGAEEERVETFVPLYDEQSLVEFGLFSTEAEDPQFVDEPGVRKLATIAVHLDDAVNLPIDERAVEVAMRFGATEIQVTAVNVETGKTFPAVIAFESEAARTADGT